MVDLLAKPFNRFEQDATTISDNFQQQLQDLVAKIHLTPDLAIIHPDYQPLLVAEQYQSHLQQMSEAEREAYVTLKLQRHLYDIFMGYRSPSLVYSPISSSDQSELMINQGNRWYETEFYRCLVQSNHGKGYGDPDWLVVGQVGEQWQVRKNSLTLSINPEQHLLKPDLHLQRGQLIAIKMPPNLVDHGFYIAVGDAGSVSDRQPTPEDKILQLYFNIDSATALILLDDLTKQLNNLKIPFDFKLAYRTADFEYLGAATLEFIDQDWQQLQPIIQDFYTNNRIGFKLQIPFFCQYLASGLGMAEKPYSRENNDVKNLGYCYCKTIAQAIVEQSKQCSLSQGDRINYVFDYISQQGIDLNLLYLN